MAESLITESDYLQASARGEQLLAHGPLALSARHEEGRICIELDNGCAFAFPVAHAQGLADAAPTALSRIEVTGAGLGLYWPDLDVDLYVPHLIKGVFGSKRWMAQIGAVGGRVSSPAKAAAARANGRLGGRPRKARPLADS